VADAWSAAEWPESELGREFWHMLFVAAAYPKPQGPLTLYRGASPSFVRRMAWTTDIDRARWFAQRFLVAAGLRGRAVYQTTVLPEAVLAMIDTACVDRGRNESEVVVDPAKLGKVTRVEKFEPPAEPKP
jgi:hypothetical protein